MGEVTGFTAGAMAEFVDNSVTGGSVDGSGHLQLTTHGGDTIDAGAVVGPIGPTGAPGMTGAAGDAASGSVMMFAAVTPPTGWLLCDGSAVSRSTYADLFSVISTTYGAGNGTTTFNVPDFRLRTPRMDNANLALAGGTTPTSHAHSIDGGAVDAVAQIQLAAPTPFLRINRINSPSWSSNFSYDASGENFHTVTQTSHISGAAVVGTTATATDNLDPFLNISFIIKF